MTYYGHANIAQTIFARRDDGRWFSVSGYTVRAFDGDTSQMVEVDGPRKKLLRMTHPGIDDLVNAA